MSRHRTALLTAVILLLASGAGGCSRKPATQPPPSGSPSATSGAATPALTPPSPTGQPSSAPAPRPSRTTAKPPSPAPFPASLAGKDLTRMPTTAKVVALTFDAGANADGLASILATLDAKDVAGTFFLTGSFARAYPQQARSIVASGHRIGNHTVTHPHLPAKTDAQVRAEVLDAEAQIRQATGHSPKPWFRFPYGDRTAHTISVVNGTGYACIRWTVDTLGWKGTDPGGQTAATVTKRVLDGATPGEIVLMHVGSNPDDHTTLDANALAAVIDGLRARGYTFVTLDYLL